jgi:hypothetical protein
MGSVRSRDWPGTQNNIMIPNMEKIQLYWIRIRMSNTDPDPNPEAIYR